MPTELKLPISTNVSSAAKQRSGKESFLNREIQLFGKTIRDKVKERFYSDMHVLLSASVDIRTALELFTTEIRNPSLRLHFENICSSLTRGSSLSLALKDSGKFSQYEYVSIRIGEESGQLNEVLFSLSEYFAKRIKMKRQIVSVFTYPFFLITVTFGVLYFMLNNVVPMFAEVFQRFGKELPPFTQKIISASNFVGTYSIWLIVTFIVIATVLFFQRNEHWYRKLSANFIIRMPLFGVLIRKIYLARFCQAMKLLIKAKIPLVEALEMVENMIGFVPLEQAISSVRNNLLKGSNLHTEMASHNIFDRRMVSLIKVSEEVNKLDSMFEKLANQYNDEVEHRTSVMGSLIEPLMILTIGAIVGVILVAMYQPLFNISNILE